MKSRTFKLSKPIRTLFWSLAVVLGIYLSLWCCFFVLLALEGPDPYWSWSLAVFLNPYSANAHLQLGKTLGDQSMVDQIECARLAMPEYEKAIRLKPDFAEAHLRYASSLEVVGKGAEAKKEYEIAFSLNPSLQSEGNLP